MLCPVASAVILVMYLQVTHSNLSIHNNNLQLRYNRVSCWKISQCAILSECCSLAPPLCHPLSPLFILYLLNVFPTFFRCLPSLLFHPLSPLCASPFISFFWACHTRSLASSSPVSLSLSLSVHTSVPPLPPPSVSLPHFSSPSP